MRTVQLRGESALAVGPAFDAAGLDGDELDGPEDGTVVEELASGNE